MLTLLFKHIHVYTVGDALLTLTLTLTSAKTLTLTLILTLMFIHAVSR